jgi:hypothetical protein
MRRVLAALGASLLIPATGWACGACIEDKMAATYDHALVEQARVQRKLVVFCDVQGAVDSSRTRPVATALERVPGVQAGSVRLSAAPAALSFVLDPAVQAPEAAVGRAQRSLGAGYRLTLLRTLGALDR